MSTDKKHETKYVFDFRDKSVKDALKILAIQTGKSLNEMIKEAIQEKYKLYDK